MLYGPTLLTLMGEEDPDLGFWATAAASVAKVGARVGKRVAKIVKARRKLKKIGAAAKQARAVAVATKKPQTKKTAVIPVTVNELRAVPVRAGVPPLLILGGVGVVGLLLLTRGKK